MMLKAVIFDVGGVLIRTHSRAGREKWAARVGMAALEFENFIFSGESGQQAQLGQKTNEAHWQWLRDYFGLDDLSIAELRHDFFAGDALNKSLLEQIKRLRQAGYLTGLLSNTNDSARHLLTQVYPLIDYFNSVIISAEVGLMKPDPKIYHLAAESLGVQPAETLFVDDFIENIEGAKQVGMLALHFTDPEVGQQQLAAMTGVK